MAIELSVLVACSPTPMKELTRAAVLALCGQTGSASAITQSTPAMTPLTIALCMVALLNNLDCMFWDQVHAVLVYPPSRQLERLQRPYPIFGPRLADNLDRMLGIAGPALQTDHASHSFFLLSRQRSGMLVSGLP